MLSSSALGLSLSYLSFAMQFGGSLGAPSSPPPASHSQIPKDLRTISGPSKDPGPCASYQYSKPEGLGEELIEMSGIVPSHIYQDLFYHIRDSGNDPLLIMSNKAGKVLGQIPFAKDVTDPEDLAGGPCPWGASSCLFVADTGNNFNWRTRATIFAVDEATLFSGNPRIEALTFAYAQGKSFDVEAIAVDPKTADIYLFSKQKKGSLVYRLKADAWLQKKEGIATYVTEFPHRMLTGASFSENGDRLLLLNSRGAHEYWDRKGDFQFQKNVSIRIPEMAQQEAITYLPDQRSFLYSSEQKRKTGRPWGLIEASCQPKSGYK